MRFDKRLVYFPLPLLLVLFGVINPGHLLADYVPPLDYTTVARYVASFEEGNIVKSLEIDSKVHESFGLNRTWITVTNEKRPVQVVAFFVEAAESHDIEILTGTYRCELRRWDSSGVIYSVLTKVSDDPNELVRYRDRIEQIGKNRIKERVEESRQVVLYGVIIFCLALVIFLVPWWACLLLKRKIKHKGPIIFSGIVIQIAFVTYITRAFLLDFYYYTSPPTPVPPWADWLGSFLSILDVIILFQIIILLGYLAGITLKDKKGKVIFWGLVLQFILLLLAPLPSVVQVALAGLVYLQILVLLIFLVFRSLKKVYRKIL